LYASAAGATFTKPNRYFSVGVSFGASGGGSPTNPFPGSIQSVAFQNVIPLSILELEKYVSSRYANGAGRELGNEAGFTLKYKEEDLADVDKLETITTLKRQDTSNQNPILYETGNLLY